jgi:hypothetical protein
MTAINMTPDSSVLQQLDGQWQKIAMMLVWKLRGREMVRLTHADMEAFAREFAPGLPVLYTHGHSDSIDFTVIDEAAAIKLAAHEKTQQGHA